MELNGKWCFITGGSSGIGLAIAGELRRKGAHLLLIARRQEKLEQAQQSLQALGNGEVRLLVLDITDRTSCRQRLRAAIDNIALPDILINNAGAAHPACFVDHSDEQLDLMLQCNFLAPWAILQIFVPQMLQRGSGCIINVASMAGLLGIYGYSGYAATKGSMVLLTQVLRNELVPHGLRVLLLCPGDTLTSQLEAENLIKPVETKKIASFAPPMTAIMVARSLLRALAHKSSFYVVPGFMNKVSWWAYRLLPSLLHRVIDSQVRSVWKIKKSHQI